MMVKIWSSHVISPKGKITYALWSETEVVRLSFFDGVDAVASTDSTASVTRVETSFALFKKSPSPERAFIEAVEQKTAIAIMSVFFIYVSC